ncbi:MAG: AMP-binding protein [Methylobacillus sp.]|jgi:acyl-coenzyme A synthetase/AMP-(fatty) acid ligase/3-hydroxymyristoyl/3-hydroxydecanoyl-(acyl carrier protein) dehydratase|nr:AMP-binding protein [Methylobacillus sp.]
MDKPKNQCVVLMADRPAEQIVAIKQKRTLSLAAFCQRIILWRELVKKQKGVSAALYFNDTAEFAAAMLALLQEGRRVFLPSDTLSATCHRLKQEVDFFVGDFPQTCQPLNTLGNLWVNTASEMETSETGSHCSLTLPADAEIVIYTSGSTGQAQAIPKNIMQFVVEVATLEKVFDTCLEQADIIATVSHQHIYGLLFKVFLPLVTGRAFNADIFHFPEEIAAVSASRDVVLVSSPAYLKRFAYGSVWQATQHRIRAVFSSGGLLDYAAVEQVKAWTGNAPVEVYGSSETGGIAWRKRQNGNEEHWRALPGVAWRCSEASGALEVSSPHLRDNNWFSTADRIQMIDEQHFLLLGRLDRIVKIEEKRISLEAIESALKQHHWVTDARVVVVDMEQAGKEKLAAVVVLSHAGRQQLQSTGKLNVNSQLRHWLAKSVEQVALPKIWRYLETLPVNAQGKTTYSTLKTILDTEMSETATLQTATDFPEFAILEQTRSRVLLETLLPPTLLYFQGHFPGQPILPGVVQLDWAIRLAKQYFSIQCDSNIQRLKFQHIITPGMRVRLELVNEAEKSRVAFRYFSETAQHAEGQIVCENISGEDVQSRANRQIQPSDTFNFRHGE